MKPSLRILALVLATSAATSAAVVPFISDAQAPATTPAPQLVAGLPDFTRLVEQVGPAVVNVEAQISGGPRNSAQVIDEEDIPEIFRRFFGPGFPGMPGTPDDPRGRPRGTSLGTGFIISGDGYILTNHHVIDGADEVTVKLSDRRELTAKIVGSDPQTDVALLKVAANNLPALRIGDSDALKAGQWVVAIGSPFGLDHSVTAGVVSAVGRTHPFDASQRYVPFIQTDVAINRGNSGGPLLDTRGQVVGINSQIFSNSGGYMGVSFAIPIDTAMGVVSQLKKNGRVERGMIGVTLQEVTPDIARASNLPDTRGALVNGLSEDGPGQKAGIQLGDVIRSVNGRPVDEWTELPPIIGAMSPGTRITLGVMRDGRERDIAVTLAPLQEGAAGDTPRFDEPQRPGGSASGSNALGIVGQDLDAQDRRQLGLDKDEGVGVARVQGLAAREAGIRPGDVILAVGRTSVASVAELDRALADVEAGDTVMLLVRRRGATQYIAVTPRADDEG